MSNESKPPCKSCLTSGEPNELSAEELAEYELGVQELFQKVPEMFVNFSTKSLQPSEYPTDQVLHRLIRERDAATPRQDSPGD